MPTLECEDYHCRCTGYVEDRDGNDYCGRCGCVEWDHGRGFRAQEQANADQGRATIQEALRREGRNG